MMLQCSGGKDTYYTEDRLKETTKLDKFNDDPTVVKYRKYGTPGGVKVLNEKGAFTTKYWRNGYFESSSKKLKYYKVELITLD